MDNCDRNKILSEEHKTYIETYRHHFDLLAKATLIYFTATGALGSYVFRESTRNDEKLEGQEARGSGLNN